MPLAFVPLVPVVSLLVEWAWRGYFNIARGLASARGSFRLTTFDTSGNTPLGHLELASKMKVKYGNDRPP